MCMSVDKAKRYQTVARTWGAPVPGARWLFWMGFLSVGAVLIGVAVLFGSPYVPLVVASVVWGLGGVWTWRRVGPTLEDALG